MSDWQPIDTAPKDGTRLLLVWADTHGGPLIGHWSDGDGAHHPPTWLNETGRLRVPTHWMPLPPLP